MKEGKNTEQSWSPACHNNNCIELVSDSPCQMAPSVNGTRVLAWFSARGLDVIVSRDQSQLISG